ncbi:oxygen-dependent coproporphyrinogen-iii oxidase chloroplastic [Phtheirospermum japonicum]|uniref:Oxygen-dependent coproporphyrinogen-iii oxidase chloroplastic n=1 Tax=Phtheirospermum japonicum TaxID=374723 RepID=A0A830CJ54_9LAMI|nr:oxygen-dependent coproporphyrinogen-iii oxidase chloroplastic [Phtheirospermum japonicum]
MLQEHQHNGGWWRHGFDTCLHFLGGRQAFPFEPSKIRTESLTKDNGESEEATAAAGLIEKLSVEGNDKEDKPESKNAPSSSAEKKKEEDDNEKQEKPETKE